MALEAAEVAVASAAFSPVSSAAPAERSTIQDEPVLMIGTARLRTNFSLINICAIFFKTNSFTAEPVIPKRTTVNFFHWAKMGERKMGKRTDLVQHF